ncbi:unnamed protein product [Mytilus coruscus]|uniref:Uncharacterized protein n=1 Tax=Mytilus coruscus TaxID=42192 RepID=A0A6J8AQ81_MYTCO|nr:unnamed protein product [Mytilus coruscus]
MADVEESLTQKLQKAVRENNIRIVEQLIDKAYRKTCIVAKLNGKSSIDLASDKDVQLEIWELLLKHADEKTLAGENSVLKSFEQLLQAPYLFYLHAHVPTAETHVCQIKKVKYWLLQTKERTEKSVIRLRLHFLRDLCRIKPSNSTIHASADDVTDLAEELIKEYKVNLNNNATIYCPLYWAVVTSNVPLLNLFLKHGANFDCLNRFFGGYLLHILRDVKGQPRILDIVEILVDAGASLTSESHQRGYTALHSIIINLNPVELDKFLDKYTEKIKSFNQMPFPFVHGLIIHPVASNKYALKIGIDAQNVIIEKLAVVEKHKIDINTKDINGMTILHFSCWLRYTDVVKHLLAKSKLPLLQKDKFGRGCLYYAMTQPSHNIWPETENLSTLGYILDPSIFISNGREIPKKDQLKLELLLKICTAYFKSKRKLKSFREPVNTRDTFVQEIMQKVQQFVERLKDHLERDNPLFASTIELAGSTSEGTKINPQDEFDYQFKLTTISQCIRADCFTLQDEVRLRLETQESEMREQVQVLQKDDQTLNVALMNSFNTTIYKIFQKSFFWKELLFYWRTCYYIDKETSPPKTLVAPLHLTYIGTQTNPDLDISIDLVPVIVLDDLPNKMKKHIPQRVVRFVQNSKTLSGKLS